MMVLRACVFVGLVALPLWAQVSGADEVGAGARDGRVATADASVDEHAATDLAVRSLLDEARAERDAGRLDDARACLEQAASRLSTRAIDDEASFVLHRDLEMLGRSCESLPAMLTARRGVLAMYERLSGPDDDQTLASLEQLAQVLSAMGRLEEVAEVEQRMLAALERRATDVDDPRLAFMRGNLAVTLVSLGRLETAAALQQTVIESLARVLPEGHPDLLDATENAAHTWALLGDHDRAVALMEGVLRQRLSRSPADDDAIQRARRNLAAALGLAGDLGQARVLYEEALEVLRRTRGSDDPLVLSTELNLAATLRAPEDLERAYSLVSRVYRLRERNLPAGHPERLLAAQNLASVQRARGELEESLRLTSEVYDARATALPRWHADRFASISELVLTRIVARSAPGDSCALLDEALDGVLQRLAQARSSTARERSAVAATEHDRVSRVLDLAARSGCELTGLFDVIETLRFVSGPLCGPRGGALSPELRPLGDEVARLGRDLARLVAVGPGDQSPDAWRGSVQEASLARDALLEQLESAGRRQGLPPARVEAAVVARALGPSDAVVSYLRHSRWEFAEDGRTTLRAPDGLLAFVVTPDEGVRRVDLGSADRVETLVTTWRETLGIAGDRGRSVARPTASAREREAGEAVRAAVFDALALPGNVARVLVVADDVLHLVPFEALPVGSGQRLVDRITIERGLSLARLGWPALTAPAGDASVSLLLVGDIDYDSTLAASSPGDPRVTAATALGRAAAGFVALPGTATEIASIALLFEQSHEHAARRLTGAAATREALFAGAAGARFVHVATHGWFAAERAAAFDDRSDPVAPGLSSLGTVSGFAPLALSGLALAGANRSVPGDALPAGLVTAEELTSLPLGDCELAVLSACETGVGLRRAGRGLASLQAALQAAGARRTLTSLWPVGDKAASEFMVAFYSALWTSAASPSAALAEARRDLRSSGAPIRDWAAWVLTDGFE